MNATHGTIEHSVQHRFAFWDFLCWQALPSKESKDFPTLHCVALYCMNLFPYRESGLGLLSSAAQVPQGTTPRSIVVHLRGALTRTCKPGDAVSIAGIFLPEPYTGYRAIKAGLLTSTYLDAMGVTQLKQSYQEHAMDAELQARMHVSPISQLSLSSCTAPHKPAPIQLSALMQGAISILSSLTSSVLSVRNMRTLVCPLSGCSRRARCVRQAC